MCPANTVALGCTDPLASNYDPKARFYTPCGVLDKERQKAALLGAFVGHEDWTGIRSGWTQASADPCASGAEWEGLTCDGDGRVVQIHLSGKSGVRGQLYGPALEQLHRLQYLCVPHHTLASVPCAVAQHRTKLYISLR